ncbi:MAG: hypothetical protein WDZ93_00255 [Candidatus Paceibacterota bacterium]
MWFQFPMIFLWFLRGSYYSPLEFRMSISGVVAFVGFTLMLVSMVRIYKLGTKKQLITSDIFALTRHPMYHGMFIADAATFLVADLSDPLFWISWLIFVGLLLTAGWYQERETLARWGEEAGRYYARTPRFIFGWLWR